ncbi:MAG: ParB/RepB/Spo0J family partition protein [Candidatus Bathyarchaeia archaeon]
MVRVEEILVESIVIPKERARSTFTPEQDAELEASIRTHGFTVPILVAPLPGGKYLLIDGEHRLNIAKRLGLGRVPAVITEPDEKRIALLNILANTARGTQDPMGVAEVLKKAKDAGATEEELAAATGHTIEWVRFYLTLNDLPDFYKEKLRSGELKVGHIRKAAELIVPAEIDAALRSALIHKWTVEELGYYVERRKPTVMKAYGSGSTEPPPPPPTPEEAAELTLYATCMGCQRSVDRRLMRMPQICEFCYTLLRYITDQFGDPREAMNTIYKAYMFYVDAMEKMQAAEAQTQPSPVQATQQAQQMPTGQQAPTTQAETFDKETLELALKIKRLKEAGLI